MVHTAKWLQSIQRQIRRDPNAIWKCLDNLIDHDTAKMMELNAAYLEFSRRSHELTLGPSMSLLYSGLHLQQLLRLAETPEDAVNLSFACRGMLWCG